MSQIENLQPKNTFENGNNDPEDLETLLNEDQKDEKLIKEELERITVLKILYKELKGEDYPEPAPAKRESTRHAKKEAEEKTEKEAVVPPKRTMTKRQFLKTAGVIGAGIALGAGSELAKLLTKKEAGEPEELPTTTASENTPKEYSTMADTAATADNLEKAGTEELHHEKNAETAVEHGLELPKNFGKISEHMDMKFFNEKLKDASDKLMYLEWLDETLNNKVGPAYLFMFSKNRAMLEIVDRNGKPVKEAKIICGKNYGDGIEPGQTPAGYFETAAESDKDISESHKGKLLHILIPNAEDIDPHAYAHDTIPYISSNFKEKEKQDKHDLLILSEKQAAGLRSNNPKDRRLSLECLRIPGIEQGFYDEYITPVKKHIQKEGTGKTVDVYPIFAISPEERKPGMINIIDVSSGRTKYVTPKEYTGLMEKIIEKNNRTGKEGK